MRRRASWLAFYFHPHVHVLAADDPRGRMKLASDMRRTPLSLAKMSNDAATGTLNLPLEDASGTQAQLPSLKEVPEDKWVVLGLITTKRPHLEPIDELATCIREASRFVPRERLAVSPQCGFSNSVIGTAVTPADQERKLRRAVETARRVWGEDG